MTIVKNIFTRLYKPK